jgi:hypothetical protein
VLEKTATPETVAKVCERRKCDEDKGRPVSSLDMLPRSRVMVTAASEFVCFRVTLWAQR